MRLFLTDTHVRDMGLEPGDHLEQAFADAAALWEQLNREPWQAEHEVRNWGEREGIGPDRFNAAMEVLQASGRVYALNRAAAQAVAPPAPSVAGAVALTQLELEELPQEQIKALAALKDIDGRSKKTKAELVDALLGHAE